MTGKKLPIKKKKQAARQSKPPVWDLKLYIAGNSQRSIAATRNLKEFCEEHLPGQYRIQIIDLIKNPQLAKGDQILAIPTLVRKLPSPIRKIIGDLSVKERVLVGFDFRPRTATA